MPTAANRERQRVGAREFDSSSNIFCIRTPGNEQRVAIETAIVGQSQAIVLWIAWNDKRAFELLSQ
jgi:hypothetical protein